MSCIIPFIVIVVVVIYIFMVKYKDYKNKKMNPPKEWEGLTHNEYEQEKDNTGRKTEAQKGNGRAGVLVANQHNF